MSHPLHIVDVFAERRYAGNQLAVVLEAGDLSTETMQAIAREMNYSETTFVTGPVVDGALPVRIFTPAEELPFAGHPTLGTAWVARHHVAAGAPDEIALDLQVGRVPVAFKGAHAWLTAPPIELGATFPPEKIAPAVGLTPGDLDSRAPARHVSAGISFLFAPVANLETLRRCRVDLDGFRALREEGVPVGIYLFCTEAREAGNDLAVRMLFDADGAREDPATGSAAACLGAYLLEHRLLGDGDLELRIEQGHEIARPSLLLLRARRSGGGREISVGGSVVPVAEGRLL